MCSSCLHKVEEEKASCTLDFSTSIEALEALEKSAHQRKSFLTILISHDQNGLKDFKGVYL